MTVIIGAVGEDGVALVTDGIAKDVKNEVVKSNYRKIEQIGDGIFFGAYGVNISENAVSNLASHLKLHLSLNPPYTTKYVGEQLIRVLDHAFSREPSKFRMILLVAGYGRDKDNKPTEPLLMFYDSKKPGEISLIKNSPISVIGDVKDQKNRIDINQKSKKLDDLVNYSVEKIRELEKEVPNLGIGGEITVVKIKGDRYEEGVR